MCHCFQLTYTTIREHHRCHTCEPTTAGVAPATEIRAGCMKTGYDRGVEDTLKVPGGCANVTIVSPIFDLRHQHIAIDHA